METKELISSYDEVNDTFVGKMADKNGYYANYDIADGIFLSIDKNRLPVSVQINNASDVLNVKKGILKNPNVAILIECMGDNVNFRFCIEDKEIFSSRSVNVFDIAPVSYRIRAN